MGSTFDAIAWVREVVVHATPKSVLHGLIHRMDLNGYCYPSQALLAEDVMVSERTVRSCLAYLEEVGLIERSRRSNGRSRTSDLIQVKVGAPSPTLSYTDWGREQRGEPIHTQITYRAARMRVTRMRGAATQHECFGCGEKGSVWVYDGSGTPITSTDGHLFSMDPDAYSPMCRHCAYISNREVREALNRQLTTIEQAIGAGEEEREVGDTSSEECLTHEHSDPSLVLEMELMRFDVDVSRTLLQGIKEHLSEMDDETLFMWSAQAAMNPDLFQNSPGLRPEMEDLLEHLHREVKRRMLNPNT
jgi:hypothetical protein